MWTGDGDTDTYTYDSEDYRIGSKRIEYVCNLELSDIIKTDPEDIIIGGGGGSNPKPGKPGGPIIVIPPDPGTRPRPNSDAGVSDVTYSTDDNLVTNDEAVTYNETTNDDVSENDVSENNDGPSDTSEIVLLEETQPEEFAESSDEASIETSTEESSEETEADGTDANETEAIEAEVIETEESSETITENLEETVTDESAETSEEAIEEPETEEIEAEDTSSSLRDKLLKENQRTETTASKIAGLNAGTQGKITIGGSGSGTGTDLGSGLGSNATLNTRFSKEIEITTSYCYDRENKNLLVTTDSDGTIVKYVYGNGLISSYETTTDKTEYQSYSYDLRGSVTSVSDENGTVTAEYSYSTYGERTVIEGKASILGYCARDGVLTETNGLIYMRARYYSTELMRFINEDIITGDISNSNSLNRYAYVQGNPATNVDPFGLCAERSSQSNGIWVTAPIGYTFSAKYKEWLMSYLQDRIDKPAPDYSDYNPADYPDYTEMIDEWMYGKEAEFVSIIDKSFPDSIDGNPCVDIITPVMWFYNQVKDGGPMDIKTERSWIEAFGGETWPEENSFVYHDEVVDKGILGNITYGYVGSVMFNETVLDIGGGLVETKNRDKTGNGLFGFIKAGYAILLPNYGEAPEDILDIEKGVKMYEEIHK